MADLIGMFFDDLIDRLSGQRPGRSASAADIMDDHDVEEALQHLKSLTIFELKRRGLWTAPPEYVGQNGVRWLQPGVLDELVHHVFLFVLVERYGSLANARKLGKKTGWRVRNYVGFFITERQKEADPIGYRVFGRLKAAVEQALERGFLFLFGEDLDPERPDSERADEAPELDNQSRLTYARGRFVAAALDRLRDAARFLNDRLLPSLVTDEGRAVPKLVTRFADALETLGRDLDDFEAFRLGELGKELKDDTRHRFPGLGPQGRPVAVDHDDDAETPRDALRVIPVEAHEETLSQWNDRRRLILKTVSDRIDALPAGRDRDELWTLWTSLKSTRLLSEVERAAQQAEVGDDPPDPGLDRKLNRAELERELGISRRRLPKLLERLEILTGDALLASRGVDVPGTTRHVNGTPVPATSGSVSSERASESTLAFPSHPFPSPEEGEPRS